MATEKKDFKDWIDREAAALLASQIQPVFACFDSERFVASASDGIEPLSLLQRVDHFTTCLEAELPNDYAEALEILLASLPPALEDCEELSSGWHLWPVAHFVKRNGLQSYEPSLAALVAITQRFTGEFAVRPFVTAFPDRIFADILDLTKHANPHVRRWCSEGLRPRLPWGERLTDLVRDPTPLWPILDALRDDPELYVRRSVANHLNDIAKDHPDLVIACCRQWSQERPSQNLDWVIRHALRTLIKDGHPAALDLLGYHPPQALSATLALSVDSIAIGESLPMKLTLTSRADTTQDLVIDYVVHYQKKNGEQSPKVFKWTTLSLGAGETIEREKAHSFRVTTIRKLYSGAHRVEIRVNGASVAECDFVLQEA